MIHRFLIVPGYTNSGPRHWQTLWEHALHNARRVQMPDWDRPDRDAWVAALDDAIRRSDRPPILIAHSCGVGAVAHWAAAHTAPVHGALLVAPADTESPNYPHEAKSFHPLPKVKLPFHSILASSSNDPYCAQERAHELAHAWGSRFVDVGPCGHVNTDAGFGAWPAGERLLNELTT